ncbi:radical SAM protein [Clostridium sp. MSJ-8]|uniref:elongator complex protein 3 n=1 Tax=Clostridium sp. MSJ-8 TaxID=2841510 RepID=UPI001C0F0D3D|nr:radical SAM protein [Clostridium sp. MSJ-8]MBU5488648.1 radical SAM protein [Clostridium sp. MSJ-8]
MEGCPHQCVFCNQDRITGISEEEKVDATKVRKIIDEYLETMNRDATIELSFFGGTFTAIEEKKQRELLEVAKEYKEKGLIDMIHMSTRPDAINDYILSYLQEYLVDVIELGIQSLDEEVLLYSGRGHNVEVVTYASNLIKKYGFTLGHQIMIGLPKDTYERDIYSVKESIKLNPDIARIYPALVIKDTPMEKMYRRNEYIPYSLEKAVDISKDLLKLYEEHGVKVIRIGLQPTETIAEGKDVVAGPFHPAFRELVEGSLFADIIRERLFETKNGTIYINPKDISKLYANKKMYFKKLIEEGYKVTVKYDESLQRGKLKIN